MESFREIAKEFLEVESGGDGYFFRGREGVINIYTAKDRKADFIEYRDKVLVYVKSALGHPAIYPFPHTEFEGPAEAVLMDLDGTSVHSESFWIWIIQLTTGRLLRDENFELEDEDIPHVSGHSVSEHLQYCIQKYCPDKKVEEARSYYFEIVKEEMNEILKGRGKSDAFVPSPGLREFLLALKENHIKVGLVTSGLYEKAWPEIVSAFRTMNMGDPKDFYDAIITAGFALRRGETGTLGELSPKPHPWLYAETARVGLGIDPKKRHRVIGIEDSSAGVLSVRLAGFNCIGIDGGNIDQSGMNTMLLAKCKALEDALPILTSK